MSSARASLGRIAVGCTSPSSRRSGRPQSATACVNSRRQPGLSGFIPVAFCLANVFEWWIHKYVMHRPVPGLMGIYRRHTLAHHQFFTDVEPSFDSARDFRIVFFPPYALVAFIAMSVFPAAALYLIGLPNAAWLLVATNVALYLNYEAFHYCCHVKDDHIVRRIPLVNTIRRHHIAHHAPVVMMTRNFNLTYPIADWLFGTSDLDRGLLGHVFNGYSRRFVRQETRGLTAAE